MTEHLAVTHRLVTEVEKMGEGRRDWPWPWLWPLTNFLLQLLPFFGPISSLFLLSWSLCWHLSSPVWGASTKVEPPSLDRGLLHGRAPQDFRPPTRSSAWTEAKPAHQTEGFFKVDLYSPHPQGTPWSPGSEGQPALVNLSSLHEVRSKAATSGSHPAEGLGLRDNLQAHTDLGLRPTSPPPSPET